MPEFKPNVELLRELRRVRGFSQKEVSDGIGYKSPSSYIMIELGQRKVSTETANAISEFLGFSADECLMVFFPSFA